MEDYARLAKLYDRVGDVFYELRTKKMLFNELVEMPATLSMLKDIKGKKVLDLGCGPGIYANILKSRKAKVYGIDISKKEIEIAKEHVKGVDFRVGSVYKLPYKAHYFDFAVAALVMDHFDNLDNAFKEIRRVLKRNGIFIFSIINPIVGSAHSQKGKPKQYRVFGDYFKEGRIIARWWKGTEYEVHMPAYKRTYQTWIRAIIRNHFTIEDYVDCKLIKRPKGADMEIYNAYKITAKIPYASVFMVKSA